MTKEQNRKKLLDLLDKKAFDPVLNASESRYDSDDKKRKLKEVQESTRKEKERYHHNYKDPEDIKENFLADLNSDPARKVHADLKYLDLPQLPQFKKDFLELYEELKNK